ncbi:MAG: C4-type zinc ribbon domain-containing protein [Kiritimatiellales bacterium]
MAHPLEALLVLQEKDRKTARLRREVRDIPIRKSDIEKQLEGAKARLESAKEELKRLTAELHQIEVDAASRREKITKYKQQQMEAKNNEQYRALLSQVAVEEQEISVLEDRAIGLMEQNETAKAAVAEREAELKQEEAGVAEEIEMLEERLKEVEAEIAERINDRKHFAAGINNPPLLARYNRILTNKGDFAVVEVDKDYCTGCHMKLPPQIINDALNPAKLVACSYCGRMLINRR